MQYSGTCYDRWKLLGSTCWGRKQSWGYSRWLCWRLALGNLGCSKKSTKDKLVNRSESFHTAEAKRIAQCAPKSLRTQKTLPKFPKSLPFILKNNHGTKSSKNEVSWVRWYLGDWTDTVLQDWEKSIKPLSCPGHSWSIIELEVPPDETPESMTSTATTTTRYKASLMLNPKMISTLKMIEFVGASQRRRWNPLSDSLLGPRRISWKEMMTCIYICMYMCVSQY